MSLEAKAIKARELPEDAVRRARFLVALALRARSVAPRLSNFYARQAHELSFVLGHGPSPSRTPSPSTLLFLPIIVAAKNICYSLYI